MSVRRPLRAAALLLFTAALIIPTGQSPATAHGGSSGARSADWTLDRYDDILARTAADGRLVVYPNADSPSGISPFDPPVTINHGWGGMRWIGTGEVDGGGVGSPYVLPPDVISVDQGGVMRVAYHSHRFDGTATLRHGNHTVGTGWQINDLITPVYHNRDVLVDLLARRRGTGDVYVYLNSGTGLNTWAPPQRLFTGRQHDIQQWLTDMTNDGVADLVFVTRDGLLGLFDPTDNKTYRLGHGWHTVDSITRINIDGQGGDLADIVARRSDGALLHYRMTTHAWDPAPDGTAYHMFAPPVVIGYNWYANNIIT